jgi:hypothetical protein
MKRIICFGDSWSKGHGVEEEILYKENPNPPLLIDKLREQNSWPHHLSHFSGIPCVNISECGIGNNKIKEYIKDVVYSGVLTEQDTIIVMLSYPYRDSEPISVFNEMERLLKPYKRYYFNAFFPTFTQEQKEQVDLTHFISPDKTIAEYLRDWEMKMDISPWEYNLRSVWEDESGLWSGDYHPNRLGYKLIGELIYNVIKKGN